MPRICFRDTENPNCAADKNNFLTSTMISLEREVPECHICVIGKLSVKKTIRFPSHWEPHVITAATIANNSLKLMEYSFADSSHLP